MNRISATLKMLFPEDFDELKPMKRPWWEKIDYERLLTGWRMWLIVAAVLFFIYSAIQYWNYVINIECAVMTASHQVEVALQRRNNIIAELTKTVLQYADHEKEMFKYMADTRGDLKPAAQKQLMELASQSKMLSKTRAIDGAKLESFLTNFKAVAENYPHLKLSENYQVLMEAMMEVTKQIADRRMMYNEELLGYKTYIHSFPQMIFSWIFHVRDYDFVQVDKSVHIIVPLDDGIDQTKE